MHKILMVVLVLLAAVQVLLTARECARLLVWRRCLSDAQTRAEEDQTRATNRLYIRLNKLEPEEAK